MINVPQLLICHSAELLEALEKTTDMTEEQLKQVELMDTLYDLLAPSGALVVIMVYYIYINPVFQIFQILQILK